MALLSVDVLIECDCWYDTYDNEDVDKDEDDDDLFIIITIIYIL